MTSPRHSPVPHEAEMLARWAPVALHVAGGFYLDGHDRDDVRQEAMVGLLYAIRCWDRTQPFKPFALVVIRRWLIHQLRASLKPRHRVLTDAARVGRNDEGRERPLLELLPDGRDVHEEACVRERLANVVAAMGSLSRVERHWVRMAANGEPYSANGAVDKVADNAIQRARRKLRKAA